MCSLVMSHCSYDFSQHQCIFTVIAVLITATFSHCLVTIKQLQRYKTMAMGLIYNPQAFSSTIFSLRCHSTGPCVTNSVDPWVYYLGEKSG